ncbi:MAG: DEAD/DEAH box helicase [Anaerolineales bacterium]|nr:DEAD/DEAH box helicase [Anaerolineales bacterium]
MNPIELASSIEERYQRYLKTTFYFRDPVLRDSFEQAMRDVGQLSKGPYLEATPVFKCGLTARTLFQNLLGYSPHEGFLNSLYSGALYQHQEEAIQRVFEGQNVVVATGTGSGKTEAFLYPILLHLYQEFSRGELSAGVRALILYPMNALANDQRERLGEICAALKKGNSPFRFTFGQYTGDTPENENDSYRNARSHIEGRYEGELVLRTEMRKTPPHILLTNYSMLEYLLLRPEDSELFDNGRAQWWQFLVLDEAHQYRGSKGIEMGMLLRRLKRRLREGGRDGAFRCIATSATIAGGEEDRKDVAKFASALFGEEFHRDNMILGETELLPEEGSIKLPTSHYPLLLQSLEKTGDEHQSEVRTIATDLGLPPQTGDAIAKIVGQILQKDTHATKLRHRVTGVPIESQKIADEIFPDLPKQQRISALSELVELLLKSTDPISGAALLSARYHIFLRSLEGAFITYRPEKKIYLDRQSSTGDKAAFEVALCRECGQHYLVGRVKDGKLQEAIRDPGHNEFGADFFRPVEGEVYERDDEDNGEPKSKQSFRLCVQCGAIWPAKLGLNGGMCGHKNSIEVIKENPESQESQRDGKEDQLPKCSVCGYQGPDPVREVIHGTDGPHAVIATTLHQNLPPNRRKVLAFADGRQEAAFFAWYLQKSYEDIRDRNMILQVVRNLAPHTGEGLSPNELVTRLRDLYRESRVFEASIGGIDLKRKAWLALYREFLTDEPRISLDGVGLLHWSIKWPDGFEIPKVLLQPPWSLSEQEVRDLMVILFGFLRRERAVELCTESVVSITWEELNLQARQVSIQLVKSRGGKALNSWAGKTTARAGFLKNILTSNGVGEEEAAKYADDALRAIWDVVRQWDEQCPQSERILIRVGDAHRLNPDWWRAFPVSKDERLYKCDTCGRLQKVSIKDICPRHKCPGNLKEVMPSDLSQNHYRLLYDEFLPARLVVEEHTAQIDKETAREFQKDFKQNKIDVLSCSTTFELGVDLGDLDTVFLRNVPPEAFNYAQRVGRAGRRKGFPGVAITYCKRSPHDLFHFAAPEQIMLGMTRPPALSLQNDKIILRHIAATALSHFFRSYPQRFKAAGDKTSRIERLFINLEKPAGISDFQVHLQKHQTELEKTLLAIVPVKMVSKIGLDNGEWIAKIAGSESRFAQAEAEVSSDYQSVRNFRQAAFDKGDDDTVRWAGARSKTIAEEDVLSFLSRKAVIPKYGFPVDVVELDTHRIGYSREAQEVSLQRDLAIAVAEFAPSSKLIANKKEWESKGLKMVLGKVWPQVFYKRCTRHNFFRQWKKGEAEPLDEGCNCNNMVRGEYIDPIFGFVTAKGKPEEPKRRPVKTFTTRPYFVGFSGLEPSEIPIGNIQVTKTSPGTMVVLCEGRRGEGFGICERCGAGFRQSDKKLLKGHKTPLGVDCSGKVQTQVSLGHEFPTDVTRLQFLLQPPLSDMESTWFAYSLAYAIVEGAATTLEVPSTDLNATVAYASDNNLVSPIILYDNVPGGAGLVARLEDKDILRKTLEAALKRVSRVCGCGDENSQDTSCYGCLRSYRNQFAHQYLQRGPVLHYLEDVLAKWS